MNNNVSTADFILGPIKPLIGFLGEPENRDFVLFIFKIIFILISLALLFEIIKLIRQAYREKFKIDVKSALRSSKLKMEVTDKLTKLVKEKWQKIVEKISVGTPENLTLAVIEADSLIDEVLKIRGVSGENMAERLKSLNGTQFKSLEQLWEAHKIRNHTVHNPNYQLSEREARMALGGYEVALKELKLI